MTLPKIQPVDELPFTLSPKHVKDAKASGFPKKSQSYNPSNVNPRVRKSSLKVSTNTPVHGPQNNVANFQASWEGNKVLIRRDTHGVFGKEDVTLDSFKESSNVSLRKSSKGDSSTIMGKVSKKDVVIRKGGKRDTPKSRLTYFWYTSSSCCVLFITIISVIWLVRYQSIQSMEVQRKIIGDMARVQSMVLTDRFNFVLSNLHFSTIFLQHHFAKDAFVHATSFMLENSTIPLVFNSVHGIYNVSARDTFLEEVYNISHSEIHGGITYREIDEGIELASLFEELAVNVSADYVSLIEPLEFEEQACGFQLSGRPLIGCAEFIGNSDRIFVLSSIDVTKLMFELASGVAQLDYILELQIETMNNNTTEKETIISIHKSGEHDIYDITGMPNPLEEDDLEYVVHDEWIEFPNDVAVILHSMSKYEEMNMNTVYVTSFVITLAYVFVFTAGAIYIRKVVQLRKNEKLNAEQAYNQIVSYLCHALRIPVHSLLYCSETALKYLSGSNEVESFDVDNMSEVADLLETCVRTSRQISDLANNFMNFGQLSDLYNMDLSGDVQATDIYQLLRELVSQYRAYAMEDGLSINIKYVCSDNVKCLRAKLEPTRFRQLLTIGIVRAIRSISGGTITVTLSTAFEEKNESKETTKNDDSDDCDKAPRTGIVENIIVTVQFDILDKRPQMVYTKPAKLRSPKSFRRLSSRMPSFRGNPVQKLTDSTQNKKFDMIVAEHLASSLNGTLLCTQNGEYDIFQVSVGVKHQQIEIEEDVSDRGVNAVKSEVVSQGNVDLPKDLFVLHCDDDPTNRMITERMLKTLEIKDTVSFANGQLALDFIRNTDRLPDVLLVDIYMPEMNGTDFVEHVLREFPVIPAIASTGTGLKEDIEMYLKCGFRKVLLKPFTRSQLQHAIHDVAVKRSSELL